MKVVDTVGCGEAFSAGFLHGIIQNRTLEQSCGFGSLLGALAATRKGATAVIGPEEIVSLSLSDPERVIDPDYEKYMTG